MIRNKLSVITLVFAALAASDIFAAPEVKVQIGHSNSVNSVAFSPDGKAILSGSHDNSVKLWDVATGRVLRTFKGHPSWAYSVAISPDGRTGLSGGDRGIVKVWDLSTGRELLSLKGDSTIIRAVAFSPDGKTIVGGGGYVRRFWDLATGKEIRTIETLWKDVYSLAFSPDGKTLLSGERAGGLKLWDVATGKMLKEFVGHTDSINAIAFSPDGKLAVSGASDRSIRLWDLATGKELKTLAVYENPIKAVAFSPDGRTVVSSTGAYSKAVIKCWDVETGKEMGEFPGHDSPVLSVAVSADGKFLASGSDDRTIKLWDAASRKEIKTFAGQSLGLDRVAFSQDGKTVVAERDKKMLSLWNISNGKQIRTISEKRLSLSLMLPDGKTLLSTDSSMLRLWDTSAGGEPRAFKETFYSGIDNIALSPDGKNALSSSLDKTLRLWDVGSGSCITEFPVQDQYIKAVAVSPDGRTGLSALNDGTIRLWDLAAGTEIRTLAGHKTWVTSVAFSPDGARILSGDGQANMRLWDAATGAEIASLSLPNDLIHSLAFSPDGKCIASGFLHGDIRILDAGTLKETRVLMGTEGNVNSVAFSPDGKILVSGSQDQTLRIWNPATGAQVAACISTPEGEWLAWTPDGYFDGTAWAMQNLVYVVDGMSVYSIDQLFETYYRPDIIAARISSGEGLRLASDSGPSPRSEIAAPPLVSLEVERTDGSFRGLSVVPKEAAYRIVDGTVKVRAVAVDQGGGAEGLRLFHNGKIVGENLRGLAVTAKAGNEKQGFAELAVTLSLVDGENRLRAVGFSRDKTESSPAEIVLSYSAPKIVKPALWVLAVGINQYRNSKYNLNFAVGDVDSFLASVMEPAEKLFAKVNITRIVDKAAVKTGVLEAFGDIAEKARPEDVFLFFYAGHGIALDGAKPGENDFYFVLSDLTQMTSAEQVAKAGISGTEFRGLVAGINAQKQFQVIDACNSGALSETFAKRGAAEEIALARLSRSTGSVLIAASQANQFAQEFAALGHGALTQALMEGLSGKAAGKDGQITATRLKTWVEEIMPELTKQYSGAEQYPTGFAFGQDFPVGLK